MDRNIIDSAKIDDNSNIQESVHQLEMEISKTIENNNEKYEEVQRELEKLTNERNEAYSKILDADPLKVVEEILLSTGTVSTSTVASSTTAVAAEAEDELKRDSDVEEQAITAATSTAAPTTAASIVTASSAAAIESTTTLATSPKIDLTAKLDLDESEGIEQEGIRIDDVTVVSSTTKVSCLECAN